MQNFSQTLLSKLEKQLKNINSSDIKIQQAEKAIYLVIESLEKLKAFFNKYQFKNKEEEIQFFKTIKPKLAAKLIYYNEIYNIEMAKPSGTNKTLKKYYNSHFQKLKTFHKENTEFYKYYRTGNTCLDNKYFLRGKHDFKLTLDSSYLQSDHNFATSHDYKMAQIIANDDLQLFLENKLSKLKDKPQQVESQSFKPIQWTGSKVALVELMYALHYEGVISNGNINLKELAQSMELIFNVNIGQFNRIYLEIRNRKTIDKTNFLSSLKENLSKKINSADA